MTNRNVLTVGGLVVLGGGVLFGVLELRDWRAEKKVERAIDELERAAEQEQAELQRQGERVGAAQSLVVALMEMEDTPSNDKLYNKLLAAIKGDKSDIQIEQLIQEAVRISIENKDLEGDEWWKPFKELLKRYKP